MTDLVTLTESTPSVQYLCRKDKHLAKVIHMVGSISYKPHLDDPFPFLIYEIVEQMLSVKAGAKIYGRLEALCHGHITPTSIDILSIDELRKIGTSSAKAKYIKSTATAVLNGTLDFTYFSTMTDNAILKNLTQLPGIGMWTAKMYLIFVLDRQNILPYEDVAFLQSYRWLYKTKDISKASVEKKCKNGNPIHL
jgi:DNA-3-methyladenine glycosylase II